MRIDQARQWLEQALAHSESPRADAEVLLCHVLGVSRTWLRTWPEKDLAAGAEASLQQLLLRRLQGEPVAHLTGMREFWSLPLQVNASTLIPRPDTEVLVEEALALIPRSDATTAGWRVADLGTGTGAIALALKQECPWLAVLAVEQSPAACALARSNATQLGLDIQVLQGSWLAPLTGQQLDMLVSNPPYIDATDHHLDEGDVRFEPRSALVADEAGLADLRHLVTGAPTVLRAGGWLLLEHGWQQGEAVRQLMVEQGYQAVRTRRDYGDQERVTLGQWPGVPA